MRGYSWCSVGWRIFIYFYFDHIKTTSGEQNINDTDDDTMCGNILLSVTQKACVPHSLSLSVTETKNNK